MTKKNRPIWLGSVSDDLLERYVKTMPNDNDHPHMVAEVNDRRRSIQQAAVAELATRILGPMASPAMRERAQESAIKEYATKPSYL